MDLKKQLSDLMLRLRIYAENVVIKNELELRLREIKNDIGIKAVNYESSSGGSGIGKNTENQALKIAELEEKLNTFIEKKGIEIDRIDNALKILDGKEKEIIELKHIENDNWETVAYKVSRSTKTCKTVERQALLKLNKIINLEV